MTLNDLADITTIVVSVGGIAAGYFKLAVAVRVIDYRLARLEEQDRQDRRHELMDYRVTRLENDERNHEERDE